MSHLTWRRMVWMSALAAVSSSAYAVDGVVLINQSRALAGNVTPGDAVGFPVTISQSGSYRLSGNLTVSDFATAAILILADHVTLDLNGFSIIGPVVCTPNPVTCNTNGAGQGIGVQSQPFGVSPIGPRGVRVLNGTIRGMGSFAIRLSGEGVSVERVVAHSNGNSGIFALNGRVIDSVATLNKGIGIAATIVESSIANSNAGAGILVLDGVVTGSTAKLNGGDGIAVGNGTATGNTASLNKGFGIAADCPSSIVSNTVRENQGGSIQAIGGCTLANNAE